MRASRYSSSRQKACQQCVSAKARCDRRSENGCTRCSQRGLLCVYPHTAGESNRGNPRPDEPQPPSPFSVSGSSLGGHESEHNILRHYTLHTPSTPRSTIAPVQDHGQGYTLTPVRLDGNDTVDFSNLSLVCPINADDIQNRWIQAYIPLPGQTVKEYPTNIGAFIHSILNSYAATAVHGRGLLPFIHSKQITAQPPGSPLTTCLSLVRICSNPLPGSTDATAAILHREMNTVYDLRETYTEETLFAAFQAYLIYSMILFFRLNQSCNEHFRGIMTRLQELACASARHGLVCAADLQRTRPRWEEWIVAEAKRRTLYVMYLFDSILSTQEGLPTFLGTELRGLPAPANKLLWGAGSRYAWEREYNIHLAEWMEGGLTIDELWPTPAELDEVGVVRRRGRVDSWLENLDEYGAILYAVMKCTHG